VSTIIIGQLGKFWWCKCRNRRRKRRRSPFHCLRRTGRLSVSDNNNDMGYEAVLCEMRPQRYRLRVTLPDFKMIFEMAL